MADSASFGPVSMSMINVASCEASCERRIIWPGIPAAAGLRPNRAEPVRDGVSAAPATRRPGWRAEAGRRAHLVLCFTLAFAAERLGLSGIIASSPRLLLDRYREGVRTTSQGGQSWRGRAGTWHVYYAVSLGYYESEL
jgi:hypothetical protein